MSLVFSISVFQIDIRQVFSKNIATRLYSSYDKLSILRPVANIYDFIIFAKLLSFEFEGSE